MVTLVKCRGTWQLVTITVWKLFLSLVNAGTAIVSCVENWDNSYSKLSPDDDEGIERAVVICVACGSYISLLRLAALNNISPVQMYWVL